MVDFLLDFGPVFKLHYSLGGIQGTSWDELCLSLTRFENLNGPQTWIQNDPMMYGSNLDRI